jgi:putative component of toxin-antitoxin plasmid stabilization module
MIEVRQTVIFKKWLADLADARARSRIQIRIDRIELGLLGDAKTVGSVLIMLLCGGDKRTQTADIEKAKELSKDA